MSSIADCKTCEGMGANYDVEEDQFHDCSSCNGEGHVCEECGEPESQCDCDDADEDDEADDDSV